MSDVASKDGTTIAYEQTGSGPAVVIVGGVLGRPVAADAAGHAARIPFHPSSTMTAGGMARVGTQRPMPSSASLRTSTPSSMRREDRPTSTARLVRVSWRYMRRLGAPLHPRGERPPGAEGLPAAAHLPDGGGAARGYGGVFFVEAVGMPAEFVAPTLIQNAEIMGDFSMPVERVANVTTPTLVIDSGETPWLSYAAQAVVNALPHAERRTISGQPHNAAPEAIAPVLEEYISS
jgi:hypothetical protein